MTDASWFVVSGCKLNIQIPEFEMHNFIPEKNTILQLISMLILLYTIKGMSVYSVLCAISHNTPLKISVQHFKRL